MIDLTLHLNGDGAFGDFAHKQIRHIVGGLRVAALEDGMRSGKPSVALGFEIGNGEAVIAETSLALFLTAADALRAKYGDPRY